MQSVTITFDAQTQLAVSGQDYISFRRTSASPSFSGPNGASQYSPSDFLAIAKHGQLPGLSGMPPLVLQGHSFAAVFLAQSSVAGASSLLGGGGSSGKGNWGFMFTARPTLKPAATSVLRHFSKLEQSPVYALLVAIQQGSVGEVKRIMAGVPHIELTK